MNLELTNIDGLAIIEPRVFADERGHFFESFREGWFRENVADVEFVQDNESFSHPNVVRGLHFQREPMAQAKLVRCPMGEILDVAVDIRTGSPTFGKYVAVILSAENRKQLYIPAGFAHGFRAIKESIVQYKCTAEYSPSNEGSVNAFDPVLRIEWGISEAEAIMSEKDRQAPMLDAIGSYETAEK